MTSAMCISVLARRSTSRAPGQVERVDYEHRRNGTVNLFVVMDVHRPWRKVTVTSGARRRTTRHARASSWT
jgi:hypothetical protein